MNFFPVESLYLYGARFVAAIIDSENPACLLGFQLPICITLKKNLQLELTR